MFSWGRKVLREEVMVVVRRRTLVVKAFRIGGNVLDTAMPTQTKKVKVKDVALSDSTVFRLSIAFIVEHMCV